MELFPAYAKKRYLIVIISCIIFFLASLPFACPVSSSLLSIFSCVLFSFESKGGIYLFELFQEYTANISLVVIGFFEVVTVAYIYGKFHVENR